MSRPRASCKRGTPATAGRAEVTTKALAPARARLLPVSSRRPPEGAPERPGMTQDNLTLRHPKLLSLYAHWLEQGGASGLPLAAALDPAALRPWLGNLVLMEIRQGADIVYSYYGRGFADAFGLDRMGQSIANLPEPQADVLRAEYEAVRVSGRPVARVYSADFDGVPSTWERLVLPLSDEGETVTKLLVGAYRLERPTVVPLSAPRG